MQATKKLMIVALFLLSATAMMAQVSLGVRAGYAVNNVYTTDGLGALAPNFLNLDEANVGLVLEVPITNQFSFQPELAYTTKGFGLNQGLDAELLGVELPVSASAETRIRYVELPLLAKLKFGQDALQAYFTAGPTLSYATKGQIDTRANLLLEFDLGTVPLNLDNLDYQRLEIGATVGAGLQYDFGPVQAFTDIRYMRGFTELYDIPLLEERVRNTGFGINAGLMVPIGG